MNILLDPILEQIGRYPTTPRQRIACVGLSIADSNQKSWTVFQSLLKIRTREVFPLFTIAGNLKVFELRTCCKTHCSFLLFSLWTLDNCYNLKLCLFAAGKSPTKSKSREKLSLSPKKGVAVSPVKVLNTNTSTARRPNFCVYCGENKSNNIRAHLESKHHCEEEMKVALDAKTPLDDTETRRRINALVVQGNEKHNKLVLDSKAGLILPARRSKASRRDVLIQCRHCNLMMAPKNSHRHKKMCKVKMTKSPQKYMRQSSPSKKAKVVNVKLINSTAKYPKGLATDYAEIVRRILHNMRDKDKEVENFLNRDDQIIAEIVKSFVTEAEGSNNYLPIVRRQIRLLMTLVKAFETDPSIAGKVIQLRDIVRRENWQGNNTNRPEIGSLDRIIEIIIKLAGGNEKSCDFMRPNDVMSYSSIIRQLVNAVMFSRLDDENDRAYWNNECQQLLFYLDSKKWSRYTTKRAGAQKRRNEKINKIYVDMDDLALYNDLLASRNMLPRAPIIEEGQEEHQECLPEVGKAPLTAVWFL